MKKALLLVLILSTPGLFAQQRLKSPLFINGDRVCFVGNSITNNGEFYNFVLLYYATRFPENKLTFYNCGISGDVASGMLARMDNDILVHKPTWSVLMVGMNDVKRDLYLPKSAAKPGIADQRQAAIDTYRKNAEELVQTLSKNSKVVLEKPTIYDQTAKLKMVNAFGVNDALGKCAGIVQGLSEKYNTRLVDYYTLMNRVNTQLQQQDSSATLTGPDRVHPQSPGHLLMAYQFLKQTNAPALVSKIVVNADGKKTTPCQNCTISKQASATNTLAFNVEEYSLPFPVRKELSDVLTWVPFVKDLDQEVLQVTGLKPGQYDLLIDGEKIATYAASELNEGINLALQTNTPQYKQALKVMDACVKVRQTEAVIRSLKFVEIEHMKDFKPTADTTIAHNYLDKHLQQYVNSEHYNYYKNQFKTYLANKPKQQETEQRLAQLKEFVYQVNKPQPHSFQLQLQTR